MIKRPLVLTSVVLIMLLIVLRLTGAPYLSHDPVNRTEDGEKSIYGCFQDDVITLYGVISDYSFQESFGVTTTKLNLKDVSVLDQSQEYRKITHLGQSILVYLNTEEVHAIGNTVLVSGRLSFFEPATNPGQFDAEKYYANRDVLFAVKKASVIRETGVPGIRQWLKEAAFVQERVLENYLSEANAAIMKAMLLGNKEELDEGIEKLYQDNGIAHILAISGLHISLLGMAVYRILRRLPLPVWMPLVMSEIFLLLYGCMVGFPVSAVRAVGMFTFFLVSKWLKRSYDMLSALAFMAMLQLIVHPGYLYDCGFQLSYGAILGIGILLPVFEKINESVTILWLKRGISFILPSMSVTLVTAPILIYHYHEISFFSILLNVIILPFMGVLLMSGIAVLFFGQILVPLAKLCAAVVTLILGFYEYSCRFLELFPVGQKNIAMPSGVRIIMLFMLLIMMTILVKKKSHPYQFLFVVLSFGLLFFPHNPQFSLWITDVGQGDASVIFTEEGKCFVIDCGSTTKYRAGERILIPLLKYHAVDNIDAVFITHADADHMNGVLELLELGEEENITIGRIVLYEKALETEPEEWKELMELAGEKNVPVTGMGQGDKVQTETVTLECLYPLKEQSGLTGNASSLVLGLEVKRRGHGVSWSGNADWFNLSGIFNRSNASKEAEKIEEKVVFRALFTGDLEADGEKIFLEEYGERGVGYDLLKVGHHGSSGSSSEEFLRRVNPRLAVISCGKDNMYGHPHTETVQRLEKAGIPYLITYEEGAVAVGVGKKVVVKSW